VWSGIAAETGARIPPRHSEVRRRADSLAAATRPELAAPAAPVTPPPGTPAVPAAPTTPAAYAAPAPPTTPPPAAPTTPARGTSRTPPRAVEPTPASRTAEMLAEVAPPRPVEPAPPDDVDRDRAERAERSRPAPRPPRQARRGASATAVFLVAAASLAVGVAAGFAGDRLLRPQEATPSASTEVVADTTLDALPPEPSAGGRAEVVQTDGGRRLDVQVSRLGSATGFYEVWLIDRDVKRMVPVGVLRGDRGEFSLPEGVDLKTYPIVDISEEPLDGNPAHSGVSVLRGTMPA
jgi:hypothetical protein